MPHIYAPAFFKTVAPVYKFTTSMTRWPEVKSLLDDFETSLDKNIEWTALSDPIGGWIIYCEAEEDALLLRLCLP